MVVKQREGRCAKYVAYVVRLRATKKTRKGGERIADDGQPGRFVSYKKRASLTVAECVYGDWSATKGLG